jgi:glycosyltransferase involved in cell wall biosynthesis
MPWLNEKDESPVAAGNGAMLIVGGLQPVKGVYEICEALEILRKKNRMYLLHWIGGDTWLAPRYGQMSAYLAGKYPEAWQHIFIWKKEMPPAETQQEIEAASLVIIPSLFETFNYVALEAAARKKALLITDNTGAAGHFTHGKNAWIIPAGDAKALAEAILYLQEQPALRKEMGEAAAGMVKQQFTSTAIAESRLKVYQKVIDNRKKNDKGLHPALQFLNRYHTFPRKWYYITRSILKKLSGRK